MVIKAINDLTENAPKTYLTNTEAAGTNIIRWKNPAGFYASWGVQIGETGAEQSEVVVMSSGNPAGGTQGTLTANTLYEHPADTPVYAIKYDKVVFERSTAGTAGTAAPMTSGTITVQADNKFTMFDDTSGSPSYAYRTYFRSSGLSSDSTESDWLTSAGLTFYSLGKIRQRIKDKLFDSGYIRSDDTIDDWINEWKDEMVVSAISTNEDYALGSVDVTFGTAGLGTITTADFNQIRRLWVTYNGSDYYNSTKANVNDFLPDETISSTHPYHFFRGDSIFQIMPSESGGTARVEFYRFGTTMVNETDELPIPLRPHTKSFVEYGLAQALFKDEKFTEYEKKIAECLLSKTQFVRTLAPRDKSGPTMVDLVEAISGEDALV